eukprot:337692-Rhodomonas_salina.1
MEELKKIISDFFAMSGMLTHVICGDCVDRIRAHFDEKPVVRKGVGEVEKAGYELAFSLGPAGRDVGQRPSVLLR